MGAVDFHAHCGPSPISRWGDGHETARDAAERGFDAIVLKEHFLPTVLGVPYIKRLLTADGHDIDVIGSIALNYAVGGFDPGAVEMAIEAGAGVVWAPTADARQEAHVRGHLGVHQDVDLSDTPEYRAATGLAALDEDGSLRSVVRRCIETVVERDVVLAVGHLSPDGIEAVVAYAAELGHDRIVVDHPTYPVVDLSPARQRRLAALGATINVVCCSIAPATAWQRFEDLTETIRRVGVDQCMISSDLGQVGNPSPAHGLVLLTELLGSAGFSRAERRQLVEHTPKDILGCL
ncbi:MAG: DUF6282 family protein [Salinirussus sp.]